MPQLEEEMESDRSFRIVEAGTSESQNQPTDEPNQDASFITPTKKVDFVRPNDNTTPRRSPRVPKPKLFPDEDTSWGEIESPLRAPSTPKAARSKTASTPRTFNADSDLDTPASPNLEAVGSSDSFVIPKSICEVLQVSPRKTPKKGEASGSGSGVTPSKNAPSKLGRVLNKSGPSPYKSHRPKYLPKNINLVKKKRLERNEFLQKVEEFDAQLVKIPITIASPKRVVRPFAAKDGDLMGTQPYLAVIFHPERFFFSYDEHTFDTNSAMSVHELIRFVSLSHHLMDAKDLRILSLFLTVTSDKLLFDTVSVIVADNLNRLKFVLAWEDLKNILINLGLSKDFYEFDGAYYWGIDSKVPKVWNFKFLFWLVEQSYVTWARNRLFRLLKFLSDCLFDPILQKCQHDVIVLLRRVAKHLITLGTPVDDLAVPLNHSHYSMTCNRAIIQYLAPDVLLQPLARTLAYRTIRDLLALDRCERSIETIAFSQIAHLLSNVQRVRESTTVKNVYQLVAICEVLVSLAPRPFDVKTKTFLEVLADFAENMSLTYSYYENLYFSDTVTRLRTLSTINTL